MSQPETEQDLYLKYQRQQRRLKIIGIVAVVAFFAVALTTILPRFLKKTESERKTTVSSADLDAAKEHLKPSEIARIEQKAILATEAKAAEEAAVGGEIAASVLEVDEKVEEKLVPAEPPAPLPPEEAAVAAEEQIKEQVVGDMKEIVVQPGGLALEAKNERVNAVVEKFLAATTIEEKVELVLDKERVLPLMRQFYARESEGMDSLGELVSRSFYHIKGHEYAIEERKLGDGSGNSIYVGLRNVGDNVFKIDWESMVAYGNLAWDQFLNVRPTEPVLFRCYATAEDYYNYQFKDQNKWQCYKLLNHRTLDSMYGYVERDSESGRSLAVAVQKRSPASVILTLSIPEGTEGGRLVLIDEFVQDTWLIVR